MNPDIEAEESAPKLKPPLRRNGSRFLPHALLLILTLTVYANSWDVPFTYDDIPRIVRNSSLHTLKEAVLNTSRPLVQATFWLNIRMGGRASDFRLVNILIHCAAGLLLYGVVRKVLKLQDASPRARDAANDIALLAAALWLAHPVQTESVTYIVQRAESLSALMYLATLRCAIQAMQSERSRRWMLTAIVACAAGMLVKPVIVTAPLAVFLLNRFLRAGDHRPPVRALGAWHVALASTCLLALPAALLPHESTSTTGMGSYAATVFGYFTAQQEALHIYIRSSLWPFTLCIDHLPPSMSVSGLVALRFVANATLVLASVIAMFRGRLAGLAGVVFFLLLAPTSSFFPIADPVAEHRLYLPLAAIAALVSSIVVIPSAGSSASPSGRTASVLAGAIMIAGLGMLTIDRNDVYRDPAALWTQAQSLYPNHPRATLNLSTVYLDRANPAAAESEIRRALIMIDQVEKSVAAEPRVAPADRLSSLTRMKWFRANAHNLLGVSLSMQGRHGEAETQFEAALSQGVPMPEAQSNLEQVPGPER